MSAIKVRKKPVVVEAMQYDGENGLDIVNWVGDERARLDSGGVYIETLEGTMRAGIRWWVIKGVLGEFYPCDPDVFDQTYDRVQQAWEMVDVHDRPALPVMALDREGRMVWADSGTEVDFEALEEAGYVRRVEP